MGQASSLSEYIIVSREHGVVPVEHGVVHVEHGVVSCRTWCCSCTLCSKILFFGVIIYSYFLICMLIVFNINGCIFKNVT